VVYPAWISFGRVAIKACSPLCSSLNSSSRASSHLFERALFLSSCSRARRGYIAWGMKALLLTNSGVSQSVSAHAPATTLLGCMPFQGYATSTPPLGSPNACVSWCSNPRRRRMTCSRLYAVRWDIESAQAPCPGLNSRAPLSLAHRHSSWFSGRARSHVPRSWAHRHSSWFSGWA